MEEIVEAGYTEDKVVFIYQSHGFMTKKLSRYWAQRIFFPYVAENLLMWMLVNRCFKTEKTIWSRG
jgi:hypothetical protein